MSKSKALVAAELVIATLEARVAALEAKVTLARECWRNQRAQIADLESQIAARGRGVANVSPAREAYLKRQAAKPAYVPLCERDAAHAAAKAAAIESGRAMRVAELVE